VSGLKDVNTAAENFTTNPGIYTQLNI